MVRMERAGGAVNAWASLPSPIRASRYQLQAGDAGMSIWTLDDGICKPEW